MLESKGLMLFDTDLEYKVVLKFVVGDTVAERLVHYTPGPKVWVGDLTRSSCCVLGKTLYFHSNIKGCK